MVCQSECFEQQHICQSGNLLQAAVCHSVFRCVCVCLPSRVPANHGYLRAKKYRVPDHVRAGTVRSGATSMSARTHLSVRVRASARTGDQVQKAQISHTDQSTLALLCLFRVTGPQILQLSHGPATMVVVQQQATLRYESP